MHHSSSYSTTFKLTSKCRNRVYPIIEMFYRTICQDAFTKYAHFWHVSQTPHITDFNVELSSLLASIDVKHTQKNGDILTVLFPAIKHVFTVERYCKYINIAHPENMCDAIRILVGSRRRLPILIWWMLTKQVKRTTRCHRKKCAMFKYKSIELHISRRDRKQGNNSYFKKIFACICLWLRVCLRIEMCLRQSNGYIHGMMNPIYFGLCCRCDVV